MVCPGPYVRWRRGEQTLVLVPWPGENPKVGRQGRTWEHRIFPSAPPELPLVTKNMPTKTLWDPICTDVVSFLGSAVSLGDRVGNRLSHARLKRENFGTTLLKFGHMYPMSHADFKIKILNEAATPAREWTVAGRGPEGTLRGWTGR